MDKNRLRWACRRGMLELDELLVPFCDKHFESLSKQQKEDFERLLSFQDPDLFVWFVGSEQPDDPAIEALIHHIKAKVKNAV